VIPEGGSALRVLADSREWLCANGIGGFASGTVSGILTRRYHGLLVAALHPPLGRTVMATKVDEVAEYAGSRYALGADRWADGTVAPQGYRHLERFHLEGTSPVWTYAAGEALLEKRVWMEPGANTTYVSYTLTRATTTLMLEVKALVNHRDYHSTSRGEGWHMDVAAVPGGVRVLAFDGARPLLIVAEGAAGTPATRPAHTWYRAYGLARERERGLDWQDDHLHAMTAHATLRAGETLTLVVSADVGAPAAATKAWQRRADHEAGVLARWRAVAAGAPAWIDRLALAADQFVVGRLHADDPGGMTVIAGYPWFGDWGRDTMIALPGLALCTGRAEVAARILRTFARHVDGGMLPNRFPDALAPPEYNAVDATLWYFDAIRAYTAATGDDVLVSELFPALESIVRAHVDGTRHGIGVDPADGLLRAGDADTQLTWMDARVDGRAVTPRAGKPVEINALWYNAMRAMTSFARRLGRPEDEWASLAARAAAGFARFWNDEAGYCYDVIDGPHGHDPALRPNQILAVSLADSPLPPAHQRGVVEACARHLLTPYGLRTLSPDDPAYQGHYAGDARARDGAYHQGTVWPWLLGPFALAHHRVFGDTGAALAFLDPLRDHLDDYGIGSIAEIFDGDPPHAPNGCIAQAWSVAETLRAWSILSDGGPRPGPLRPPTLGSAPAKPWRSSILGQPRG
jgi:predicted glycogen debranching enzyme